VIRGVITDSHIPWRARALLVGAAALASVFAGSASALAGVADPDPSFSGDGRTTVEFGSESAADSIAVGPDGDILVVGSVGPNGARDFGIARLHPDGTLDAGFSGDGRLAIDVAEGGDDYATGVAVRADGRIVVVGTSADQFAVLQLEADGAPDDDFAGDGSVEFGFGEEDSGEARDVVLDQAGNVVVVGHGDSEGDGGTDVAIARITPAGDLDSALAEDGKLTTGLDLADWPSSDRAFAAAVLPSGEIAIAGSHFQAPDGNGLYGRIGPSGTVEVLESVGAGRYYSAQDVAVLAGGTPLAVGYFQPHGADGGSATAWAFGASGVSDGWDFALDPEVRARAESVAPLADGRAIVAGAIGSQGNLSLFDPGSDAGFLAHGQTGFAPAELGVSAGKPVAVGSAAGDFAVARFLAPSIDAPETKIVAGPRGKVDQQKVKFRFRADPDAERFECKLDRGRWRECGSPARFEGLDSGRHWFKVRAVSGDGKPDPTPAKRRFKVA
jgi:uncharacterized delta-60 repeat protein